METVQETSPLCRKKRKNIDSSGKVSLPGICIYFSVIYDLYIKVLLKLALSSRKKKIKYYAQHTDTVLCVFYYRSLYHLETPTFLVRVLNKISLLTELVISQHCARDINSIQHWKHLTPFFQNTN